MQRKIKEHLVNWKLKKGRKPLILQGARQVGKTYSLKEFGKEYFSKVHYLNFEEEPQIKKIFERDLIPARILQEISFYADASIDVQNDLVIFDEAQECPKAVASLKYFAEESAGLAVCCAGSLLGLHFSEAGFPVGKVEFLKMHPLTFEEFLAACGDAKSVDFINGFDSSGAVPEVVHAHLWEMLKKYMVVGGMPEAALAFIGNQDDLFKAYNEVRKKQSDLVLAFVADIAKHSGKENSMRIERLWQNIPHQLAREQNGSASKFRFKGVIPGLRGYSRLEGAIDWLQSAGLIIRTAIVNSGKLPFSSYSKENFFKLYFFDAGLLGAVSRLPPKTILDYEYGSYKGYFAENFAAQEFIAAGIEDLCCWRENTAEVEFLVEAGGNVFPVEIKSGWATQSKSLAVFSQKYNPPLKIILSANNFSVNAGGRLIKMPLYLSSKIKSSVLKLSRS